MPRNERTKTFTCEVCQKPTTRMFGFLGTVTPTDQDPGKGGVSLRSAVHGYCREHRELVAAGFPAALAAEGTANLISDPPSELRPDDLSAFEAAVDQMRMRFAVEAGLPLGKVDVTQAPEECPHCGAKLAWREGPHAAEAARRPDAEAWECTGCGAAGMLIFGPSED